MVFFLLRGKSRESTGNYGENSTPTSWLQKQQSQLDDKQIRLRFSFIVDLSLIFSSLVSSLVSCWDYYASICVETLELSVASCFGSSRRPSSASRYVLSLLIHSSHHRFSLIVDLYSF